MPPHFQNLAQDPALDELLRGSSAEHPGYKKESLPQKLYRIAGKRFLDVTLSIMALPLLIPILIPLILLASMDGGNPFYTQARVGKGGKIYKIWKIRTMVVNADQKLKIYLSNNPDAKLEWDSTQKLVEDPRVTAIGSFLRKYSLDELPQIWNVLRGEMSFVGPRPMMEEQRPLYPGTEYYDLRPGITGLWQVSARNQSSFADRAKFDAEYSDKVSLFTDLKLIAATFRVVWHATGH